MTARAAVWVAEYASASFDFVAVGETEEDARAAMARGARAHARTYGAPVRAWFDPDGVNVTCVPMGACARDGRVITS